MAEFCQGNPGTLCPHDKNLQMDKSNEDYPKIGPQVSFPRDRHNILREKLMERYYENALFEVAPGGGFS
jgi:hypothetical protein